MHVLCRLKEPTRDFKAYPFDSLNAKNASCKGFFKYALQQAWYTWLEIEFVYILGKNK